jgi:hypothetical protein
MNIATRMICRLLMALMAWMPFHVAQAGMIGTEQFVGSASQADRAAVLSVISRADVASQLQTLGLDQATAKDRVAAMTDQEIRSLAGDLNALPAGASSGGAVLVLILIGVLVWWLVIRK